MKKKGNQFYSEFQFEAASTVKENKSSLSIFSFLGEFFDAHRRENIISLYLNYHEKKITAFTCAPFVESIHLSF